MAEAPSDSRDKLQAQSFISPEMAKALAHPTRNQIMALCNLRPMSPSDFCKEMGLDLQDELPGVARHFRDLEGWGLLELACLRRTRRTRGRPERVYRAVSRIRFSAETWEEIPLAFRAGSTGALLTAYVRQLAAAAEAGTLDSDRHLSWKAISLDEVTWEKLMHRLDEVLDWVEAELEPEAAERLAAAGQGAIPAVVGLAGFRSATARTTT